VQTWFDYRSVWARHPLVLGYAVIVLAVFVIGVVGTVEHNLFAILFIPALLGAYVHHQLVTRRLDR
jgi:hypothetical protein